MEGKLLKLEDVARQWTSRYVEVKAAMLEFPKRVAFRFTDPEVRLRVEEEANAFVVELLERYSREMPPGLRDRTSDATIVNDPPIVPYIR